MHGNRPARSHTIAAAAKLVLPRIIKKILASMSDTSARSKLTPSEYSRMTSELLAAVESTLDDWLQRDVIDIDSGRTGGLHLYGFAAVLWWRSIRWPPVRTASGQRRPTRFAVMTLQ